MLYQNYLKKVKINHCFSLDKQKSSVYNIVITQGESMSKQNANSLKDKTSGVRLTQKQVEDLELLAKKHNNTMSEQIREAVEEYILHQHVRDSLSDARKEISKKSMLEKIKLVGGLALLIIFLPTMLKVGFGIEIANFSRIAMTIGFPLALWALFYNNIIRKYWRRTLIVVFLILVSSLIIFRLLSYYHQDLFKLFFICFCKYTIGLFVFLCIGVKFFGAKID